MCDMDGVAADLFPAWYGSYNRSTGDNLIVERVTEWDVSKFCKYPKEIYSHLDQPSLFRYLEPLPGALEAISHISQDTDFWFLTDGQGKYAASEKQEWVDRLFPSLGRKKVIICPQKSIIRADLLIDDSPRHLKEFFGRTIKFNYPHNRDVLADWNVSSWAELLKLWPEIYSKLIAGKIGAS